MQFIKIITLLIVLLLVTGCGIPKPWQQAGFTGDEKKSETWKEWRKRGISPEDAKLWKEKGFEPWQASSWIENDYSPNKVIIWSDFFGTTYPNDWRSDKNLRHRVYLLEKLGIYTPKEAKEWKKLGVKYSLAGVFIENDISPKEAMNWIKADVTSNKDIQKWLKLGVRNPNEIYTWKSFADSRWGYESVAKWKESGFTAEEAKIWSKNNYKPYESRQWIEVGMATPQKANKWRCLYREDCTHSPKIVTLLQNAGVKDISEAQGWAKYGIRNVSEIKNLKKLGYSTPKAAYEYIIANEKREKQQEAKRVLALKKSRLNKTFQMQPNKEYKCASETSSNYYLKINIGSGTLEIENSLLYQGIYYFKDRYNKYTSYKNFDSAIRPEARLLKRNSIKGKTVNLILNTRDFGNSQYHCKEI